MKNIPLSVLRFKMSIIKNHLPFLLPYVNFPSTFFPIYTPIIAGPFQQAEG
jgi:hypothetical protein